MKDEEGKIVSPFFFLERAKDLNLYTIISCHNEDDLKNVIHNQVQRKVDSFLSAIEVLEDVKDLKEAIFSFCAFSSIRLT